MLGLNLIKFHHSPEEELTRIKELYLGLKELKHDMPRNLKFYDKEFTYCEEYNKIFNIMIRYATISTTFLKKYEVGSVAISNWAVKYRYEIVRQKVLKELYLVAAQSATTVGEKIGLRNVYFYSYSAAHIIRWLRQNTWKHLSSNERTMCSSRRDYVMKEIYDYTQLLIDNLSKYLSEMVEILEKSK